MGETSWAEKGLALVKRRQEQSAHDAVGDIFGPDFEAAIARTAAPPSDTLPVPDALLDTDDEPGTLDAGEGEDLTVEEVRKRLGLKARELLSAPAKAMSRLTKEIQRLRVVLMILLEAEGTESDPSLHKELSLLNKLVTGKDLDGLDTDVDEERRRKHEQAETLLLARGVDPLRAGGMVRLLQSVMGAHQPSAFEAPHGDTDADLPDPEPR